nr:TSC22 domain family protein 1 [Leptinotarsa decemlineata]
MNADPRRSEKILRYVSKTNGNGQEELAPDYVNPVGQYQVQGNAQEPSELPANVETNLQPAPGLEETQQGSDDPSVTTNATNVIATSPQYGVAIIPNATTTGDLPSEMVTVPTETLTDTTAKATEDKELHSTPSRNDRFKVVKIASLEPFKRGRWKCMDYVDEAPPAGATRVPQSVGSIQLTAGQYMQTQSLPQQQIQQMLLQGGFTNGTQFFANVAPQMVPSGQYFYPQVANIQSQTLPQVQNNIPTQFIGNQPYFSTGVVQNAAAFTIPQGFQNVQYVPANLIQNQNSAFVPTSSVQVSQNFQQAQSYPTQAQSNSAQPMVNGHNYNPQNEQLAASLPTQNVKSVILNSNNPQPIASQTQVNQNATVPVVQTQQYHQVVFQQNVQAPSQTTNQTASSLGPGQAQLVNQSSQVVQPQNFDQNLANNVYTNPQFAMSVNSLTVLDGGENHAEINETTSGMDAASESTDDPAKTNPVVNAIDNKIEQAMDLVKSHLMYTLIFQD